jgi:DNA repair protein RadA/Sms
VLCALASAVRDVPLPNDMGFCGEVALSGAIRPVPAAARRIVEMGRAGIVRCLAPPGVEGAEGVQLVQVSSVKDALRVALNADT